MNRPVLQQLVGFLAGGLFGVGLLVSGMTQPSRVIGFLDVLGDWDPTLLFVMAAGVGLNAIAYLLIRRRPAPLFAELYEVPTRRDLDRKLVVGSMLFGAGWGFGGFCPGPALVSLGGGQHGTLLFAIALALGWYGAAKIEIALLRKRLNMAPPVALRTDTP